MKIFNITTKKVYSKNGEEKATWLQVGRLIHFPATAEKEAGLKLEMNMFPTTQFYVFEQKKREDVIPQTPKPVQTESIDDMEIPF